MQYVTPELGTLRFRIPRVVALKDRDHKLRGAIDDLGEW
jgi:hypothetical protein